MFHKDPNAAMKTPHDHPKKNDARSPLDDRTAVVLIIVTSVLILLVQISSLISPSALNWGTHHLSFFPTAVQALFLALMAAVLLPAVSAWLLRKLERLVGALAHGGPERSKILFAAAIAAAAALFWFAQERTFLLGDGNLVARTLPAIRSASEIPRTSFQNEPFATYLAWNVYVIFHGNGTADASIRAFQFLSILFGAGAVGAVIFLARLLASDPVERVLVGLAILGAGASQIFFGYVESYAALAFGFLLFLLLGMLALRKGRSLLAASIAFGALLALHFGMVSMLPVFLYLLYEGARRDGLGAAARAAGAAALTAAALLALSGYRGDSLALLFGGGGSHALPLFHATSSGEAYALFSGAHALDLTNFFYLLSPFALLGCGLPLLALFRKGAGFDASWRFLTLAVFWGVAFTVALNCTLGMSRDWDLIASFNMGLLVAIPAACAAWIKDGGTRKRVLLIVCAMTVLATIPWIAVNASEDRSLARFESLPHPALWSRDASMNAYDELAALYKDKKEYAKAITYCEEYLRIDSNNARIYGKTGELYGLLGKEEQQLAYYGKALQHGLRNPNLYFYLGSVFGSRGRFEEAIDAMNKGLALSSSSAAAWRNLGRYYVQGPEDYAAALRAFRKSLELDPSDAGTFADAGRCAFMVGDEAGMKELFTRYAQLSYRKLDDAELARLLGALPARRKLAGGRSSAR